MSVVLPESRVVEIWLGRLVGRNDLVTEEGEAIRVIYPGRLNDGRGADLRDAVIGTGRGVIKGDVEVHVKSSGWWAHRHHLDRAYNSVILHVVLTHDTTTGIILQNGNTVPTLALKKLIDDRSPRRNEFNDAGRVRTMPCRNGIRRVNADIIGEILDGAGDERFKTRAEGFRIKLSRMEAGQLLYQGMMRALGYSRNKEPMEELAGRMPLARLEEEALPEKTDTGCLAHYQAWLLGTAGLLPSQCSGSYGGHETDTGWSDELERRWEASGKESAMSADDWCFFKVRPVNLPTRRIVAMSYLLLRYRQEGLLSGLMKAFEELPAGDVDGIEPLLMVTAGDCRPGNPEVALPSPLGRGRAADIVINVILPFAAAWGSAASRPGLAEKAIEMYHSHPCPAANTIDRHMLKQLGTGRHVVNNARRQQGLLHIYKTLCSQGKCGECPLGLL
jgi:hypothetical protein